MSKSTSPTAAEPLPEFPISVPITSGTPLQLTLKCGDALYLLGANGSGKSSLVTKIYHQYVSSAKRIAAHRQTWFTSNTVDITAQNRADLERDNRNQDAQPYSRYRDSNPAGRAGMAIFDLIDADITLDRRIASAVRGNDLEAAKTAATGLSPIQTINELMRLSNIPVSIKIEPGQKIMAHRQGGPSYSVAELSDGERNAFLIAADVLTAKPGSLIIIDEPERHLHRSIIVPLLNQLFQNRRDCAFIVSTHELALPIDTPRATTILVRECQYSQSQAASWTADLMPAGTDIDPALIHDILGSRRKIIFIEGTSQSLDVPMYGLLFPGISIVPKGNCRDVEMSVKGLRSASNLHWVSAWGIIDNDQRTPADIVALEAEGIWALPQYSVESLYFHSTIIRQIAERQASMTGQSADDLFDKALKDGVAAAKSARAHLIGQAVTRAARQSIQAGLPGKAEAARTTPYVISVDIPALRAKEEQLFDSLVTSSDWNGLISRYPLRESSALGVVVGMLGIKDRNTYHRMVLRLLVDEQASIDGLRMLLGGMYAVVAA